MNASGWEAGLYHDGKRLLRVASPNEVSWALKNWANESSEVNIKEFYVRFFSKDKILKDGRLSNDICENWVEIPELNFSEFCGHNNDYGIWGEDYIEE